MTDQTKDNVPSPTIYETLPSGRVTKVKPGFMTRSMILSQTGWTPRQFRQVVGRGELRADPKVKTSSGFALYREHEVQELLKTRPIEPEAKRSNQRMLPATVVQTTAFTAEEGVRVFNMLHEKVSLDEIVRQTGYHSAVVWAILRDYEMMAGTIIIPKHIVNEINTLPLEGQMPVTSPLHIIQKLIWASKEFTCARCKERPRTRVCAGCATEIVKEKMAKETKSRAEPKAASSG